MDRSIAQTLVPHFILTQYQQGNTRGRFQAATLFVDLSGFTPLTEALMAYEKDGAEALAEALRAIFTPLVHEVYQQGGIIPLFAGDAFTAIFPVELHASSDAEHPLSPAEAAARRAAGCALAIQRRMRGAGRTVETRYGAFTLAATAGLSFGEVQWGIPGTTQMQAYYFRGDAINGCAEAEHAAAEGEVIADKQILQQLEGCVKTADLPDSSYAKVLDLVAAGSAGGSRSAGLPDVDVASFIAQSILDLTAPAEFREVCVVFFSFQEPETIEEMHDFVAAVMALTVTYGGVVNQLDFGDMGAYLLLLFGAPVTHEDDVQRAAEFLLALESQGWALPWRAGIDYGTVWAGIRGGDERNEYGVAGNVVILACRLALMAPWEAVWISQAVADRLRKRYEVLDLGGKKIKGRREPQPVYRLTHGRLNVTDVTAPTALIGRRHELAQLQRWLQPIFHGRFGGVIYVDGEAGIGKSRLIGELQTRLGDRRAVTWLECPTDALLGQSLHPFRHALQRFFALPQENGPGQSRKHFDGVLDGLIDRLAGLENAPASQIALARELDRVRSVLAALLNIRWADSFYEQLDPQLRFDNTLSALKTFFKGLAALQPVVIHLEDGHWLDDDSRQALQMLTRNMAQVPLTILVTARYGDDSTPLRLELSPDVPRQALDLAYLSGESVGSYAEQILGRALTDDSVTELLQRTNGNPFFVEQLLLDLRERKLIVEELVDGEARYRLLAEAGDAVPPTLNAVLTARLDRLEPAVKEVVQNAAVLGREFDVPVLTQMLAADPRLQQRLSAAQAEQIWSELNAVRYLFRHALLRDAAYDMQLRARLRALHARAGQAIETLFPDALEPHYAELAYHHDRAEQVDAAVRWYGLAGERAAEQYANEDAVRYLSRGLELTPEEDVEGRIRLLRNRERVHDDRGDRAGQEEDIKVILNLTETGVDSVTYAMVLCRYAHFARQIGEYDKALSLLPNAVAEAQRIQDTEIECNAQHTWGRTLWQQSRYDEAMLRFEAGLKLAKQSGNRQLEGQNLYDMGIIYFYQAEYERAQNVIERARLTFRTVHDRLREGHCLGMFGAIHYVRGDYVLAERRYERALEIYRSIGYLHGQIFVFGYLGNNRFDLGDYATATRYHERALKMCLEVGDREGEAFSLDTFALIALLSGHNQRAREQLDAALAIQKTIGYQRGQGYSLTYLGHLESSDGRFQAAKSAYERALSLRRELGEENLTIDILAGLARAALAQGEHADASAYVDGILQWIEANGVDGIELVVQVYLTCYQVLRAAAKTDPAMQGREQAVLQAGYELLQERANAIQDEELRRGFLENVPFNRELLAAWAEAGGC